MSEVRFEVVHAYLAHHFFLPLPHVPVGIQNAAATSEKTKDPGLHKGNTGSQTLDEGLLPKQTDSCVVLSLVVLSGSTILHRSPTDVMCR